MPTPYAVRRGQTFFLKIRVPSDLAKRMGEHVVRTLRTTDPRLARARAAAVAAHAPELWSMLRSRAMARVLGKEIGELTEDDLRRINLPALHADMDRLGPEDRALLFERIDAIVDGLLDGISAGRRVVDKVRDELDTFRQGRERGLMEALAALKGATPRAEAPEPKTRDPRADLTVLDLADAFLATREMAEATVVSHRAAFREFQDLTGNKPIGRITPADVAAFKAHAMAQPGRRGREKAAVATVEKKLQHIKSILRWAADEEGGIIASNPGEKVQAPREGKAARAKPKRLAFEREALVKIFSSPLFTGTEGPGSLLIPGPYMHPAPKRYFMLCMLLTGARTDELPGCAIFDLDGVPCLDLRETGTKTPAGARLVPIMRELRDTGFLAWARGQAKRGIPLFACDQSAKRWSNFTVYYLNKLGVTDRWHVPYSFRHAFREMLREADLNQEVANRIFGHEEGTTGEKYGEGPLTAPMARAFLRKIRSPVDLSHLYVR